MNSVLVTWQMIFNKMSELCCFLSTFPHIHAASSRIIAQTSCLTQLASLCLCPYAGRTWLWLCINANTISSDLHRGEKQPHSLRWFPEENLALLDENVHHNRNWCKVCVVSQGHSQCIFLIAGMFFVSPGPGAVMFVHLCLQWVFCSELGRSVSQILTLNNWIWICTCCCAQISTKYMCKARGIAWA